MRKVIGISAIALVVGIASAGAQTQVLPSSPNQNGNNQVTIGPTGPNSVSRPPEPTARSNSGPPYSDCYLKCINSGNPADFCQSNAKSYCS
jgi:hypothetical protein